MFYNKFFGQFRGVCLKVFGITVAIPHLGDNSSESDVEESPPRPSPVEESAALDTLANFAVLEDTDKTMCTFVFAKRVLGIRQPKISSFFPKIKCSFVGLLLVVFFTDFRQFVSIIRPIFASLSESS